MIFRCLEVAIKMPNTPVRTILLAFMVALTGCAPADIPSSASIHWSVKGGFSWTRIRDLENGCAYWMAKENWANFMLLVDTHCDKQSLPEVGRKPGISYLSAADYLKFQGYWPWSSDVHLDRMVWDAKGDLVATKPCGYSLSASQLNKLRLVAQQAYDATQTAGEERVLGRVKERLANVGAEPLASSQSGCTDLPVEGVRPPSVDVWVAE